MRTDHVTALLIKKWLQDNAPDLANSWNLEVDAQIMPFATKIETLLPQIGLIFTSQNILAKIAIEMWDLKEVALLAGGAPTPLSPRPSQLLYYTDGNAEAVEEARSAGYNALQVNVTDSSQIQQLIGAKTAIATGLFHFLPDEAARTVFSAVDQHGFHTIVFSHGTPEADQEAIRQYENLGIRMFMRTLEQTQALFPPGWKIDYQERVVDYMRYGGELGAKLADAPHMMDIYKATKVI